jgi:hypothetical protein
VTRFGFEDTAARLVKLKSTGEPKPDTKKLAELAEAGRDLGFVPREARAPKTRRRKREKRSNILIHGPERVLVRFRDYADREDLSYWEAIERLLEQSG